MAPCSCSLLALITADEVLVGRYREALLRFMWLNHEVAERVMRAFAIGLGWPEDYFREEMDPHHHDNLTTMVGTLQAGLQITLIFIADACPVPQEPPAG